MSASSNGTFFLKTSVFSVNVAATSAAFGALSLSLDFIL